MKRHLLSHAELADFEGSSFEHVAASLQATAQTIGTATAAATTTATGHGSTCTWHNSRADPHLLQVGAALLAA